MSAPGEPRSPEPAALTGFYEKGYSVEDPEEAAHLGRWRELGARSKARHVIELCRRAGLHPVTVVEIGCGDGALLHALAEAGLGERLDGFELSAPAARLAAARGIPRTGRIETYDGARVPVENGAYDLAVVSHVLEHVRDPPALLREAVRVAAHVLVEVPLEANRSAQRPGKRSEAQRIGHIQSFARADVRALAEAAGLHVLAELTDPLPRAHHAFFAQGATARAKAALKWALRVALWRMAPRRAEGLFTVHYAVLLGGR